MEKNHQADDILRYQFTAYLRTAVLRKRQEYISKQNTIAVHHAVLEEWEASEDLSEYSDLDDLLPLFDQLDDERLVLAVKGLSAQEYRILVLRVTYGLSHRESAELLSQNFWTVKKTYLETIRKLRNACEGGEDDELC